MSRRLAVLLVLALPPCPLLAQPAPRDAAVQALDRFLTREVADKALPALSIALVEDQRIVWAKGYGFADPEAKRPATADTVYRVGSVSKLFTDIAVMQLVAAGRLDLDAPVTKYLPDFKPLNRYDKAITLRMLMAHRSGLVREPPVGNYFDPSVSDLTRTVRSLNQTELVYEPGTRTKYSNAGIAVVGRVLEEVTGQPFARAVYNRVLDPLHMRHSAFAESPELTQQMARGLMVTYHGRAFPAPTFPLGMAPAGSLFSSANDLARFLMALFAGGHGPGGPVLDAKALEQMFTPQFVPKGEKTGFGLGFHVSELDGRRRVGHGGAIYGFATELAALPDEKLGVVVITSRDIANGVTRRAADAALRLLLAARRGRPLPTIETTEPLAPEEARRLAGRYAADSRGVDLIESAGRLRLLGLRGGPLLEVRKRGPELVVDDVQRFGPKLDVKGDRLTYEGTTFPRVAPKKPAPPPARWQGLIGEYGWDHNVLYIFEKDGKLWCLIEWFEFDPLEEVSADVYMFPATGGLYHGERLVFTRDSKGRATRVEAGGIVFERRRLDGEDGSTFKIRPLHPVEELRRAALKEQPPRELGTFRKPDLVELTALDPTIKLDLRYATDNNFLGKPLYPPNAKAYLQRPAAEALVRVHKKLAAQGYGLLIHDAYRPWYVTKMFWEATPPNQRVFVADPSRGSRHNRGCAVDLTLYDRATGKPVRMVSGYDEFSDRAYPDYPGGTSLERWHRDLLRRAMEADGFTVYEAEWWHFDFQDWRQYPILNESVEARGR